MQFFFILWLVFEVAVTLFAALNGSSVPVNLIFNTYHFSLAIVILGSAFAGALAGYTVDMFPRIKRNLRIRELEKKLRQCEFDLENCKGKLASATAANVPAPSVDTTGSQGTV